MVLPHFRYCWRIPFETVSGYNVHSYTISPISLEVAPCRCGPASSRPSPRTPPMSPAPPSPTAIPISSFATSSVPSLPMPTSPISIPAEASPPSRPGGWPWSPSSSSVRTSPTAEPPTRSAPDRLEVPARPRADRRGVRRLRALRVPLPPDRRKRRGAAAGQVARSLPDDGAAQGRRAAAHRLDSCVRHASAPRPDWSAPSRRCATP